MEVKDIVREYLRKNNYDGLVNEWHICGCSHDDLAPCGQISDYCEPAYRCGLRDHRLYYADAADVRRTDEDQ